MTQLSIDFGLPYFRAKSVLDLTVPQQLFLRWAKIYLDVMKLPAPKRPPINVLLDPFAFDDWLDNYIAEQEKIEYDLEHMANRNTTR